MTPVLADAGGPTVTPAEWDFGQVTVNASSTPVAFVVDNSGSTAVEVSEVSLGSEAFALTTDECTGTVLAAGGSCEFEITFEPAQPGKYLTSAEVVTDAAPEPLVVGLTGEGTAPYLAVEPDALDFGTVPVGETSPPQALNLLNAGQKPLEVDAVTGPAAPFEIAGGDCPATPFPLAPQASCELLVAFTPADDGNHAGTITFASNTWGETDPVTLAGAGEHIPATLAVSPADIDFGDVEINGASVVSLNVSNAGTLPLGTVSVSPPAAPFELEPADCGGMVFGLEGGESCEMAVRFAPAGTGVFSGQVNFNAGNDGDETTTLAARGVMPEGVFPIPALSRLTLWCLAGLMLLAVLVRFRRMRRARNA